MSQLEIYRQGERIFGVAMDKNLIRLGRAAPSEVELPDPSLSREHCVLVKKEKSWFIENSSKNGVYLDSGISIEGRMPLQANSRYKIGRIFSFEVKEGRELCKDKTIILSNTPTQLISVDRAKNKITLGRARIKGVDSAGQKVNKKIPAEGLALGAHIENDIQLVAEQVSQFHSRIDLIDNMYVLSDLSSTNGSLVNGTPVIKAPLSSGAKVQIGPFEFQFEVTTEEVFEPKDSSRFFEMVSENKQMKTVFTTIEVIASTDAPVVIRGETGTGKELVAKALHQLSKRERFPFIAINCAAIPKDLVESELFGHEKGSFTGAATQQIGAFEAAHQGSLFLDEIAELDLSIQAKLLRALEAKEIKRLGSNHPTPVSIRVISASHKNLLEEVQNGRFREDLFYRLQVVQIELPALRDRMEDLPILSKELLSQLKLDFSIDPEVFELLTGYTFPGNIRELKNILQRAVIEFEVRSIARDHRSSRILCCEDFQFLKAMTAGLLTKEQRLEKEAMAAALTENDFVQIKAAKALSIPVSTLNDKMKRYGIRRPVSKLT